MVDFPDATRGPEETTFVSPAAEPSPQGAVVAAPTPAPLAPGPNSPVSNQQTPAANPYDPASHTPEDVILPPPPEKPPLTEEQKFREMFRSPTEREQKSERTRLNYVDAQQSTIAGAGLAASLKARADEGDDIAKDELQRLKLDILSYKMMPAAGTVGEYYAALTGQVAGSLLAVENLVNPTLPMPIWFAKAAPLVSRMLSYGLPQGAIQGYSDYLSQFLSVQAGTKEKIDPIQVATSIPVGTIFGTLPAFMKEGKMIRPGEGLRNGESLPPGSVKPKDLADISPELTPGVPPLPEKAPPGAFQPGRPPAEPSIIPHAGAETMPPPRAGFVRLYRADHMNDDKAEQIFFTRESFRDATSFIDVPEHVAVAAQVGDSNRVLLPSAAAEGRMPLPKAPAEAPKPDAYAETVAPPLTREQAIARQRAVDAAEAKKNKDAAGHTPREKQPQTFTEWVQSMGGLKGTEPEIKKLELSKDTVRPKGKKAMSEERVLEAAVQQKRLPEGSTLEDVRRILSAESKGEAKHYHPGELHLVKAPDQRMLQIEGDVDAVLRELGQHPDQTTNRAEKADRNAIRRRAALDVYQNEGRDLEAAVYDAVARQGEHGRGHAGAKPFDDQVDIPFDLDAVPPAGGRAGEPGAGVRGPGERAPGGRGAPTPSIEDDVSARLRELEGKTIAGPEDRTPSPGIPLTSPSGVTAEITPVESLQSMMTRITDMLGLTVRKGVDTQKHKGAVATFDFASEIARINETGPQGIKRWLHEVGHFVELKTGKPLTDWLGTQEGSLRAFLGNDIPPEWGPAEIKREGFGEFIAAYVTNHRALVIQDEPFTRVWQDLMEKEAPDLLDIVNQAKSSFETYNTAPAINVGLGTIKSPHALTRATVDELPFDKRDFMGPVGRMWHNMYTSMLAPMKFVTGQDAIKAGSERASKIYEKVFNENAWALNWKKTAANLYRHFGLGDYLPLDPTNDVTTFMKIYNNGGYGKTVQDLEHGIQRFSDMERIGEGLKPIIDEALVDATGIQPTGEVALMRFDMFDMFLAARRGRQIYVEQANGRIPLSEKNPVPWSLAQTEQIIKDTLTMFPHWEGLAKRVNAFAKNQLKFEVDARTRSPAEIASLMQPQHSDYVPLLRDTKGMTEAFEPSGQLKPNGLETLGRYTREGSDRDILSPIRMIMDHMHNINNQAIENQPKLMMRDVIRLFNDGKPGPNKASRWLGEEIPNEKIRGTDLEVRDILFRAAKQAGFQTQDAQMFATRGVQELGEDMRVQMWRADAIKKEGKPIVFGWDGENERFAIQFPSNDMGRHLVNVMDSVGSKGVQVHGQAINLMADVMGFGTGVYRTLTTGTLTYQLKSSVMDAFAQWLMIPEVGFFKGFPLLFRQLASGIKQEVTDGKFWTMYRSMEGFGGGPAHAMLADTRKSLLNLERDVRPINMSPWREQKLRLQAAQAEQDRLGNELRDVGIEPHRGLFMSKVQDVVAIMERTEAWGRDGAFKAIYEANTAMGRSHKYAAIDAASKAIDITDYRQHGSAMEAFSRTIPFLSSSLAGLEKFARTYKTILGGQVSTIAEREYQQTMRLALIPRITAVMTIAGGIQAWMRDDPTYQRISPETKAKYIIFKLPFIGKGTYSSVNGTEVQLPEGLQGAWIFIPKPWEQGTVMNLAEHAVEFLMTGGDFNEVGKFIKSMTHTFSIPNFIEPPFVKAAEALKAGVDPYTGRPIVTASRQNLPPHMQSSEYTHKFYGSIAAGLNMVWDSRDARKWFHDNVPVIGAVLASPWSPMEAQYMMQGFLGDMPRELGGFYNTVRSLVTGDPTKMQDIPMLRAFIKDRMAMGQPTQELYNQIKQSNGRLTQALHGFQEYNRRGDSISAQTYLNGLDQEQRDYIRLHEAKAGPLANVMHPADRGSQLMSAVRTLKDGLLGDNGIESLSNPGTRIKLDPNRLDQVIIALSEYAARESRNSLIVQGVQNFKNQPVLDSKPYFDYIAALSPAVAQELSARLAQNKVMTIPALQKYWPEMQKVIRAGTGAFPTVYKSEVAYIAYQASALGYEGGGRKFGRSAVDSEGKVIRRQRQGPTVLPAEGAMQ